MQNPIAIIGLLEEHGIWMIDRRTWQQSLAKKAQAIGVFRSFDKC
jgi:hypothetical protein